MRNYAHVGKKLALTQAIYPTANLNYCLSVEEDFANLKNATSMLLTASNLLSVFFV